RLYGYEHAARRILSTSRPLFSGRYQRPVWRVVIIGLPALLVREATRMLARLQELSDTFRTSTQAMNDGAQRQFHETDMIATATEEIDQSHAIAEVTGNLAVIRDISKQSSG